jgi:peptidyl-prolyl cis-trans isomerase-like 4
LQYAFIEFENKESCEEAYFKMDSVLIDDRRIHVDFSQSVSKLHQDFLRGDRNPMQESFGGSSNLKKRTHYRDEEYARSKYDLVFEHSGDLSGEKKRKNSDYEERDLKRSNDRYSRDKDFSRGKDRDRSYRRDTDRDGSRDQERDTYKSRR